MLLLNCRTKKTNAVVPIPECKGVPKYIRLTGFEPRKPFAFTIGERGGAVGLSLIQFKTEESQEKRFAYPSWSSAGNLGAVITDKQGNNYVIPRPFINTLRNEPKKQNIIYRVDTYTGLMSPFFELPAENQNEATNPFGLLGITQDCESGNLFASTVFGSTVTDEKGVIYSLDVEKKEIIDKFSGYDAMGMAVVYLQGEKHLIFGHARSGDVYKLKLSDSGKFDGDPEKILTITSLGERGDDKPRKIRFAPQGEISISGSSFNYNLASVPDRRENIYVFRFDEARKAWILVNMTQGVQ